MTVRPEVVVAGDEGFAARGAAEIVVRLRRALAERGDAFVALAGGSTPRPVYRALAEPCGGLQPAEWRRVHFFWSDERIVSPSDQRRNAAAATEDLLASLDLPAGNVHAPRLEGSPAASAASYEREIRRSLQAGPIDIPRFDLVVLGVGTDGHTASLFPDRVLEPRPSQDAAGGPKALVIPTASPAPPHQRISFSFELIAAARAILFLVSGESKAEVVRRVLEEEDRSLPATLIESHAGTVRWILDSAASSRLSPP